MKTIIAITTVLTLSACGLPAMVAIPASLVAAPTVDRAANIALGGTVGHTITTDTAIARNNGSQSAQAWCDLFNGTVSWYDAGFFGQESWAVFNARNADHCERWRLYETGELDGLKQPLPVVPAPLGAKHGLRVVR